jgi:transcriptional regulator with XRE-family HTH domain
LYQEEKIMEFGEKMKQIREDKGMTQQAVADKLYVTRQAVSRWECGARCPDLITAKKIAQILDVTLDELLSGEELIKNVEKEPIFSKASDNIFQSVLYTIAVVAYLLMCMFSTYMCIQIKMGSMSGTPAGQITLLTISTDVKYAVSFVMALSGLILSVKNRLTPKLTAYIMCTPYLLKSIMFIMTYIEMVIKNNAHIGIDAWIMDFIVPLIFAVYIFLYFRLEKRLIPFAGIAVICTLSFIYVTIVLKQKFIRMTDLGFSVGAVHSLGVYGMIILLAYQAYRLNKKVRLAYKE